SHELQAAERSLSPKDYLAALLESARHAREEPADKVLRRLTPAPSQAPSAGLGAGAPDLYAPPSASARKPGSPPSAEVWLRHVLAPGVELYVRADANHTYHEMIERLLSAAGERPDPAGP